MEDLYRLMHETGDDFLSYKIRRLLHCLRHEQLLEHAEDAQQNLLSYIEHAFDLERERELDKFGDFFTF